jgi:hypothetical protein
LFAVPLSCRCRRRPLSFVVAVNCRSRLPARQTCAVSVRRCFRRCRFCRRCRVVVNCRSRLPARQ